MIKRFKKNEKGSVLVYSLILMMISLIIGIGIMATTTTGRRSTLASTKSVYSFQRANDGIEYAFFMIKDRREDFVAMSQDLNGKTIDDIFQPLCTGGSGVAEVTEYYADGQRTITFFESPSAVIPISSCSEPIKNVEKIKSIGTYRDTSRAIEAVIDLSDPAI